MIHEALVFLKEHLNASLQAGSRLASDGAVADTVVFVDGEKLNDSVPFAMGHVSALLVNLEEENSLRSADPYVRVAPDGIRQKVHPEIRINLCVLFVAHFKDYAQSLSYLSRIIQHFQCHRVFNQQNAPELSESIDQLVLELITLPFSEQNEIWSSLRTSYRPSVLYKVKMIVFRDEDGMSVSEVRETSLAVSS